MRVIQKEYQYLENMPVPIVILKINRSIQSDKPLQCVYINRAFEEFENITKDEVLGEKFHIVFHNNKEEWIKIYGKTAYHGIPQTLTEYSKKLNKFLEISTYCPETGYCACIIKDKTQELIMRNDMAILQKKMDIIISKTTDVIFDLDLEQNVITNSEISIRHFKIQKYISDVPFGLVEAKLLKEEYVEQFQKMIYDLRSGENECSAELEMRLNKNEAYHWYRLTLCSYYEEFEQQLRVIGFMRDITEDVMERKLLEIKASHDDLTGLYNRYGGILKIQKMIEAQQQNSKLERNMNAMFLVDLDNFKQANDKYGHDQGDKLLCCFAEVLTCSLRQNDIIVRLGGDEFMIFVADVNQTFAEQVCQRILNHPNMEYLKQYGVSASIGVIIASTEPYDTYYREADQAMYAIKRKKKNGYYIIEKTVDL